MSFRIGWIRWWPSTKRCHRQDFSGVNSGTWNNMNDYGPEYRDEELGRLLKQLLIVKRCSKLRMREWNGVPSSYIKYILPKFNKQKQMHYDKDAVLIQGFQMLNRIEDWNPLSGPCSTTRKHTLGQLWRAFSLLHGDLAQGHPIWCATEFWAKPTLIYADWADGLQHDPPLPR